MINNNEGKPAPSILALSVIALLFSASACSSPSTPSTDDNITDTQSVSTETADAVYQSESADEANAAYNAEPKQATNVKPAFMSKAIVSFNEPWAMTALPKESNEPLKLLVTQKTGELFIVDTVTAAKTPIKGVPKVGYGGQGGLGDIILAPDFATSGSIYLSYVEAGTASERNKYGAKVVEAKLSGLDTATPTLQAITPIWQQNKKYGGQGHYSHRLLFSPDGRYLYISSGDRQQKDPAQDMDVNLGKIIRLYPDGSIPNDNPFYTRADDIKSQFWSVGHRNVLGMTFDNADRLWAIEMGPRGGDEFNLIKKGNNYGWPIVSNGRNYSGTDIPDHDTRPEFEAPKITWTPVISPSFINIYTAGSHNDFPAWQGDALLSGLSSQALIVVSINEDGSAAERYRYDMGARIRSVLAIDGQVWLLEDGKDARLLQLVPE